MSKKIPDPIEGKRSFQNSSITTLRFRQPANERMSEASTQFVFDHKVSKKEIPDRLRGSLVETTQGGGSSLKAHQSINPSTNRSQCFGPLFKAELGGSPDEPGRNWER